MNVICGVGRDVSRRFLARLQKQIGTPDVERAEGWLYMCALGLRATARGTTLQAFVTASAADHDAATFMAGGCI